MSHDRKTSGHEFPAIGLAPIGRARPDPTPTPTPSPTQTDSIESREAMAWLVRQLKWERTLEMLRTEGLAHRHPERVAA